jgi:glycosyltransferase involved in cell wall biosynthesis
MVVAAGIVEVVRFEVFVPDVSERLPMLDLLVLASQWPDPFPRIVLEGMAAGCAVVAVRNGGGSDEMFEDGVSGVYCDRDPESIAGAIERLVLDPELRRSIGARAAEVARTRFSEARYVGEVIDCYDRLTGAAPV